MKVVNSFLWVLRENARYHFHGHQNRNPLVQYATEKHSSGVHEKDENSETLLDHLVKLTNGQFTLLQFTRPLANRSFRFIDRNVLKDELLNILIAGRDTVRNPYFPQRK
jgi:hypothetical protein